MQQQIEIFQSSDGNMQVSVQFEEETVWLTQPQMVGLFEKTKQNISLHIKNIFKEGELQQESVVKDSLTTAPDGKQYRTQHYNLTAHLDAGFFKVL